MGEWTAGLGGVIGLVQVFFAVVIGLYFWNLLKGQQGNKVAVEKESRKEVEKLERMRKIALTEPLAERTRPLSFSEIIGQEEGLKALRAALCGPNPQHVIIYGIPGVGKTAAARLVLEEARKLTHSPFKENAKFIEIDGATARFDERGIADPVIGSVHDPIYQGAGPLGMAGVPQPKAGAVTKAHGGVLFIDEIGELHPIQINKLLKVLEDRKVLLESAYYSSEDTNIPAHIHDIFQNGLPADFRLVGATTRQPQDIPAAIRSRCVEIFFRELTNGEILAIARNAAAKLELELEDGAAETVSRYASNGREAVNIIQIAAGLALTEGRKTICKAGVEWVIDSGRYSLRLEKKVADRPCIGLVNGLAVRGPSQGSLLEVEATAIRVDEGKGRVVLTGVVDEEEIQAPDGHRMRRKSMARGSLDNVLTVLRRFLGVDTMAYDIHVNFPGGIPVDGPSAGTAMVAAIYSAVTGRSVDNRIAMTGEISIRGWVKVVGGVPVKVEAARQAGANRVIIPRENWQELFRELPGVEVVPVDRVEEVIEAAILPGGGISEGSEGLWISGAWLAASQTPRPAAPGM